MLEVINKYIEEKHPNASYSHKEAFRNSVTYLVEGYSSGSGPSLREHLVSWSLMGLEGLVEKTEIVVEGERIVVPLVYRDGRLPKSGEWGIEKALLFADPLCFGPIEDYIEVLKKIAQIEYCFDNDAEDLKELAKLGYII